MIPKSERDADKVICEAAAPDWRAGAVEKWHLYCATTHDDRMGHERVLMRANEHFPYEADVLAAAHCRNRLPVYIAAAEEIERRIAHLDSLAAACDRVAERAEGDEREELLGKAAAYRNAADILRGGM